MNKKILNKDFVVQDLLQDKEYEEVRDKFIYDPTDKNISNPGIISYSLCCKVVRREIYVKAQELVDDKIVIGEDMLCSLYCLKLAKSMVCLDESFYVYRILNNSMMHSYNNSVNECVYAEGFELGNDDIPYIKIVNKNIFVEDHTASIDRNEFKEDFLWVDIFCWDNVPMRFTKLRYALRNFCRL